MKKGTLSPSYALRPEFVDALQVKAGGLVIAERALSRHQWGIANELLGEWERGGYAGEITLDEFYAEASRCINDKAGFALVSLSGETVKVWCEVFKQFENTPESIKESLPFAYFRNARFLANAGKVAVPMAAITTALDHKLTAAEMMRWYSDPPVVLPEILELRKVYPSYMWGLLDVLVTLNGTRAKAESLLREFWELVEAE